MVQLQRWSPEVSLTSIRERQRPTRQRNTTDESDEALPVLPSWETRRRLIALEGAGVALATAFTIVALTSFSAIVWMGHAPLVSGIAEILLLVIVFLAAGHHLLWTAARRTTSCGHAGPIAAGGAFILCSWVALAGAIVMTLRGLTTEGYHGWWMVPAVLALIVLATMFIRHIFNPAVSAHSLREKMSQMWEAFHRPRPISLASRPRNRRGLAQRPVDPDIARLADILVRSSSATPLTRGGHGGLFLKIARERSGKGSNRQKGKPEVVFKGWRAVERTQEKWESDHFVRLGNGDRVRLVHCTFSPPFENVPQIVARVVRPDGIRARVLRTYPYGARIELRRSVPGPALTVHLRVSAALQRRTHQQG